jgi:hypothetical protein
LLWVICTKRIKVMYNWGSVSAIISAPFISRLNEQIWTKLDINNLNQNVSGKFSFSSYWYNTNPYFTRSYNFSYQPTLVYSHSFTLNFLKEKPWLCDRTILSINSERVKYIIFCNSQKKWPKHCHCGEMPTETDTKKIS